MNTHSPSPAAGATSVVVITMVTLFLLAYDQFLNTDNFRYTVMTEFINLYSLMFPLVLALVTLGVALAMGGIAGLFGNAGKITELAAAAVRALSGYLQILAGVMLAGTVLRILEGGAGRAQAFIVVTGMVIGLLIAVSALPWALDRLFTLAGNSKWRGLFLVTVGIGLLASGPYLAILVFG